jgi:hypothetical protein
VNGGHVLMNLSVITSLMCLFIHILLFDGVFLCHRPIVLYSTLSAPFYLAPIFISILFLSHIHLLVSLFLTTVLLGILFYPILLFLVPFIPHDCCEIKIQNDNVTLKSSILRQIQSNLSMQSPLLKGHIFLVLS